MTSASFPLAGIRVVDISTSYAAPTATMYLGDMGADVIKIERREGDDTRGWGPPFVGTESAWFLSANRNKRSACIDLTDPAGLDVLMRLVETADVFVQSLNPAKLRRLQLHPEDMLARFPRLVYCAVSGFGLDGPDHGLPGYDLIAQARSGLMSVTGPCGGSPERVSTALSDVVAGMLAAFATTAALLRRERTGLGDIVDVSLLESDLALMAPRLAAFLAGDAEPRPSGGTDSVLAVYQRFETADEPVVVAVGNDRMWVRCCTVVGLPELAKDPGLATNALRRERRDEVVAALAEQLAKRTAAEWVQEFARVGVPCHMVQRLSAVVEDPQVKARSVIGEYQHPSAGRYRAVRAPWRLDSIGRGPDGVPPLLGAHTLEVLREAGFTDEETQGLLKRGIVWDLASNT